MTGLKDFSTDAASNDVAAPPILWIEGQPAKTVNNSARAVMAALACWRDDNSGILSATGGASNTYAVATNQVFEAADYANAFEVAFTPDAVNSGPSTFNPDGAGAKPLRRHGGAELGPGDIQVGSVYRLRWHPGTGAFTVVSPMIRSAGAIEAFAAVGAVPPGWLVCDGSAVSRTSYAALLAAIGLTWGAGDGATTFNVPNLRGRALFGADPSGGVLSGVGGVGAAVGSYGGVEAVTLSAAQLASHTHTGSVAAAGGHDHGGATASAGTHSHGGNTGAAGTHTHSASTDAQGSHAHSGTTDSAGDHAHQEGYVISVAGSGSTNRVVTDLSPTGTRNGTGVSDPAGAHTHTYTTNIGGLHAHAITVNGVGDHAHIIGPDGNHVHGINAVADHTHGLAIDAAGSGAAHTNMPPAAVIVWAIKA
ncbi:tail fiber protein [Methylobacterium sp. HMF5984]|uniref:phage tail protein n=1 Tax=Methylobacterium sp. HMF5984 TaxID=3367370 RepID=UPI003855219D